MSAQDHVINDISKCRIFPELLKFLPACLGTALVAICRSIVLYEIYLTAEVQVIRLL